MNGGEIGLGTILLLSLLPVAGNLIGVALAEWKKPPDWLTGGALHAAAGIGTAVATVELIPRGQERIEIWMLAAAILAGGIVAISLAATGCGGATAGCAALSSYPHVLVLRCRALPRWLLWVCYVTD